MLPVVGDIAQSNGGISRGTERQLGIVKARLGMVLGKMLIRIGYSGAHGKVRARDLARDKRKSSLAMAWNNGRKAALGNVAPT